MSRNSENGNAPGSYLPANAAERAHFRRWLRAQDTARAEQQRIKAGLPSMFSGAQFQVQSMGKWVRYLGSWEGDPEPRRRLERVAAEL